MFDGGKLKQGKAKLEKGAGGGGGGAWESEYYKQLF